ncbi:conserved oligomeric Golgi complex subunit 1-like [Corticium candelabrum]|uniref:conserved oligomeric Golgi complex subunit 1-like n=1 Tax=Corticium candelabrum TaxID=121492 RepID=UPI002E25E878|nr:conserved oligomeric Golgi complex subunit 1-like [Corticium candelabrum]
MATGGVWDNEADTNALFQQHTVDDIRLIEQKTRMDIDKKKEDLRQMVGERYHELIDAADTITEMKSFAGNVASSIEEMYRQCRELKETHQCHGVTGRVDHAYRSDSSSGVFNVAKQLKTLFDTPEKVWNALELGQHLEAARLYLQAQDIMTGLQTDLKQTRSLSKNFLASFPILQRQWSSVSQFKTAILQESKVLLGDYRASPEITAQSLCAILLLEDSTPRQAFTDFLVARKAAMQSLFHSSRQTSIKSQICNVVSLVTATVRHIDAVFTHRESGCLLLDVLKTSMTHMTSLPLVPNDVMHANCAEWMNTCVQDVHAGLRKLLTFVSSIKGLASIRDAVYSLLQKDNQSDVSWSVTCHTVLGRSFSVWDEFVRTLILEQLQTILHEQFVSAAYKGERLLTSALEGLNANTTSQETLFERDVGLFVWSETSSTLTTGNSLGSKARACTPAISRICSELDSEFGSIMRDTQYFLCDEKEQGGVMGLMEVVPFERFSDSNTIREALRTSGSMSVTRVCQWIQNEIQRLAEVIKQTEVSESGEAVEKDIDSCIFLGRCCLAFAEECANLQQILLGGLTLDSLHHSTLRSSRRARGNRLAPDQHTLDLTQLDEVKGQLNGAYGTAFRIWQNWVASALTNHLTHCLLSNDVVTIQNATAWESIKLSEETEGGKPLESTLEVPFQVSLFCMRVLFGLCKEINRVSGHTLERSVGQELVGLVLKKLISVYDKYQEERGRISQRLAVQNWFDVSFICQMFNTSKCDQEIKNRTKKLIDWLESCIDPFDFSVLEPFLQCNLIRQFQRCSVMLGPIVSVSGSTSAWHRSQDKRAGRSAATQEYHNIIPLSVGVPRFTLLPHHTNPPRTPASRHDRTVGTRQPVAESVSIASYLKA